MSHFPSRVRNLLRKITPSRPKRVFAALLVTTLGMDLGCAGRRPEGGTASLRTGVACRSGATELGMPQVSPTALETHIRFLADDSLQGRGTGTPGYDIAARYVAACYFQLGLKPAGTRGYLQPVPFRSGRTIDGSTLVLERDGGTRKLLLGRDYVPFSDLLRREVEVSGPLVFVGFGVSAPERGYDDYQTVNARGKIVAFVHGGPASFPSTERAHYSSLRAKFANAVRHGAVGVLILWTRDQAAPWEAIVNDLQGGIIAWLNQQGEPDGVFPELRGKAVLSDSTAQALFEGAPRSYAEILTAAKGGTLPAFDLPVRATIRTVTLHQLTESPNVAALLRGSDPRLRNEVVVYTAHLDHLGVGNPVKGDSIYNGALDNASGSAALLEVARAFVRLPHQPRRSVLFVAVTGEEKGLLGSDYYVQHPTIPLESIIANLNIDGLAIIYPLRQVVPMGAEHSTLAAVVKRVAPRLPIELGPDPFPEEVSFVRSDQYSFVRRGVPSLFLDMGLKSDSGVNAADRLNEWVRTRYHTPQDDLSQPMDLVSGARHAQFNFLVGLEIANADEKPAWNPGDFFGRTFGRQRMSQYSVETPSKPR
jgi:peptidase M28-like protein